jgi:pyrroline-5-carboxylate reductase
MKLLLIGCGKMGDALKQRWEELSLYTDIVIVDPVAGNAKTFADIPPGFAPDAVIFAVKPQTLPDIAVDYKKYADAGALFISIAAGKPISFFEGALGATAKIVRCMPNTPAAIGKGISGAYANQNVSEAEKKTAVDLLGAVGAVVWVENEDQLNPLTALSGSGPAYVFLLMEVLAKVGLDIGLDAETADKLARHTVIGSAALAEAEGDVPAEQLRKNVTSPGGTTQAALEVLMAKPGLQELFNAALHAATDRARELSK